MTTPKQKPQKRKPMEYIRNLQRRLTLSYINCNSKFHLVQVCGHDERERVSAELIRQAELRP